MSKIGVVIVAAGNSSRMQNNDKQTIMLFDIPVIVWGVGAFQKIECVSEIVLATRKENIQLFNDYVRYWNLNKVKLICEGGDTRQKSVFNGVKELSADLDYIAIHDGARPFVTEDIIDRCLNAAIQHRAATASVKTKDTIKISEDGFIKSTPDRNNVHLTQTPQIFESKLYLKAMEKAIADGLDFTDDCQLIENIGEKVWLSEGAYDNIKITTPDDLIVAESIALQRLKLTEPPADNTSPLKLRIGHGYDVHRLVEGRKLILGGVEIGWDKGLLGYSDADVLVHSIMDALLGAMALGDIGKYFPDTNDEYHDADSIRLLKKVINIIENKGGIIGNIDATILAEKPKLSPFIIQMRKNIAAACRIDASQVSIKATTEEGLGFTGLQEGIAAHSVCTIGIY